MKATKKCTDNINDEIEIDALKALRLAEIDHAIITAKTLQHALVAISALLPEVLSSEIRLTRSGLKHVECLQKTLVGIDTNLPFLRHPEFNSYWLDYGVEKLESQQVQIYPLAKQLGHFVHLQQLPEAKQLEALQVILSNKSWLRYFYPTWHIAKKQLLSLASTTKITYSHLHALVPAMKGYRSHVDEFNDIILQHPCLGDLDLLQQSCFTDLTIIGQIREQYKHIAFCWSGDVSGFHNTEYIESLTAIANMSYGVIEQFKMLYTEQFQAINLQFKTQRTKLDLVYADEFTLIEQQGYIEKLERLRDIVAS